VKDSIKVSAAAAAIVRSIRASTFSLSASPAGFGTDSCDIMFITIILL